MRFLVTGGAGFIGANYVRKLVDGSFHGASEITVLDKLTYAGNLKNLDSIPSDAFRFVQADICDQSAISDFIRDVDVIVNFAAESHVDRSINNPGDFIETNIKGVQTLLNEMKNYNDKTFIQISTDEVYGSINEGSWSETSPLLPNSPYSASKAAAEMILRSYFKTYGLDIRITRSSNNYGPYQHPEKLIPLVITNILRNKKIPVYGEGTNVRDWLHVDDNCESIHEVILRGKPGEIYNIGGGNELSNIELIRKILNSFQKCEQGNIDFVVDRKGHDLRYSISTDKISTEIGISPKINFNVGLESTIDWYKNNFSWWVDKVGTA
jgi:dTDP-glucose 4,6-dehydratase